MSSSPLAAPGNENLRGIIAMLIATAGFVCSDLIMKHVGQDLPPGQLMFFRGLFATAFTGAAAIYAGVLQTAWKALTPMMLLRCFGDIGANLFFFLALVRLSFVEVNAIAQFTPLALTAGAAIFLNEPVGWRRWAALGVGLVGVMIIIRPGSSAFHWASLFVIASVLSVTARDLITRHMGLTVHILVLSFFTAASVTVGGFFMMFVETWHAPSWSQTCWLALSAAIISTATYAAVIAVRKGELAVVAPFRYSIAVYAIIGGYVFFSELPDSMTLLGIAIVVGAGLYTLHRERVRRRARIISVRHD